MSTKNMMCICVSMILLSSYMQTSLAIALVDQSDIDTLTKIVDQKNKLEAQNAELEKQVFTLQGKINSQKLAEADLRQTQSQIYSLQKQIDQNNQEIGKLHQQHLDLSAKIKL